MIARGQNSPLAIVAGSAYLFAILLLPTLLFVVPASTHAGHHQGTAGGHECIASIVRGTPMPVDLAGMVDFHHDTLAPFSLAVITALSLVAFAIVVLVRLSLLQANLARLLIGAGHNGWPHASPPPRDPHLLRWSLRHIASPQ